MVEDIATEQLRSLPPNAIVGVAVRAAMRVQPLFSPPPHTLRRDEAIADVDRAIQLVVFGLTHRPSAVLLAHAHSCAIAAARIANPWKDSPQRELRDTKKAAAYAAEAAASAASTAIQAIASSDDQLPVVAALSAVTANAALSSAADAARFATGDDRDFSAVTMASRRDIAILRSHADAFRKPTFDPTETGPLGNLWPDGPPLWYMENHPRMTAELARIHARSGHYQLKAEAGQFVIATSSDQERSLDDPPLPDPIDASFEVFIRPGEATSSDIQAVLAAINDLHVAYGGLGLQFTSDGMLVCARQVVPS